MKFRTRLFLAAFGVAGLTLVLAGILVAWSLQGQLLSRIETELVAKTALVGELVNLDMRSINCGIPTKVFSARSRSRSTSERTAERACPSTSLPIVSRRSLSSSICG